MPNQHSCSPTVKRHCDNIAGCIKEMNCSKNWRQARKQQAVGNCNKTVPSKVREGSAGSVGALRAWCPEGRANTPSPR
eukprot:15431817-Alexandrium_andersonii.AAC.1